MSGYRAAVTACVLFAASSISFAAGPQASKEAIKAHLTFLADDLTEGREAGSRGYDVAAAYVAAQFAQYGLTPKGDNNSYLQQVPLGWARAVPDSASMELQSDAGAERLDNSEFQAFASVAPPAAAAFKPLVFVGYGIRDQRLQHDDYSGIDVKDKIVVVLSGYPDSFPSDAGAHLGGTSEKRKTAAAQGAAGLVTIWSPTSAKTTPFAALKRNAGFPVMDWLDAKGQPAGRLPGLQPGSVVSADAAKKLFARAGIKLDDVYAAAAARKPLPRGDLNLAMKIGVNAERKEIRSSNVVGMIAGSDSQLKNEYVVYSAHLDHLGMAPEKTGDKVYNGALDNAAGVATLLETARLFSQMPVKPKRSILFVAVTAEEKGLLGSDFFASQPTVPGAAIVANVNLDMPLLIYDFDSVIALGADHSSIKEYMERAVKTVGVKLMPDPWPQQNLFIRTDHYSFVRQGVPSVSVVTGLSSFNKDEKPEQIWAEFLKSHYHQLSDELSLQVNYDAAARFAQLNYAIALDIANSKQRPAWNKGDYFGDAFRK